jgi:hypothetical protein
MYTLLWVLLICLLATAAEDLYALLGVSRSAKANEIRAAYRAKAKETHPDKSSLGPEEAAAEFRKVASAYEVLSDAKSRQQYDATGRTDFRPHEQQQQQQRQHQHHNFHFGFGFGGRNGRVHRNLYDPWLRRQILSAQSRVLTIHSLRHLLSVAAGDDSRTLERFVLLAFVDSSGESECTRKLQEEILFPWPFAGYSESTSGGGHGDAYWDDILTVGRVVLVGPSDSAAGRLAAALGLAPSFSGSAQQCPQIVLLSKGLELQHGRVAPTKAFSPQTAEQFSEWVWPQLSISVTFVNKSLWPLSFWWLDGTLGKRLKELAVGERYQAHTFLSHVFILRPTFVEGNALTNESSLLWYTAKLQDHGREVEINSRCIDRHGDCQRWRQEGFCDSNPHHSRSWYVQQNPGHCAWTLENCVVSCKRRCQAEVIMERGEARAAPSRVPAHRSQRSIPASAYYSPASGGARGEEL